LAIQAYKNFKISSNYNNGSRKHFFEEFLVKATLNNGKKANSKQSEILVYEGSKIKSLRLYFDRLDFLSSIVKDFISKTIINQIIKKSLEGLN
jgi:hypothetical protein